MEKNIVRQIKVQKILGEMLKENSELYEKILDSNISFHFNEIINLAMADSFTEGARTITSIENELQPDGLNGYIFHLITGGDFDNLCDTAVLEEGACMVLKGSAPARERREMFLKIYDGCKKIADHIKKDVGWQKQHDSGGHLNINN